MKKSTKITTFASMLLLALCFSACGGPNGGETPVQPEQENREYTVNVASGITNGTVTVSPTKAAEGTTVTMTFVPHDGAELIRFNVKKYNDNVELSIADTEQPNVKTFVMPAQNVVIYASFYIYPAPYTVTLGEEGSGYIIYKSTGDTFTGYRVPNNNISGRMAYDSSSNYVPDIYEAAEHYYNEYEKYVNQLLGEIETLLADKNQATKNYFKDYIDAIKAKAGTYARYIDQVLETIYNGSSFLFEDMLKNIPLVSGSRYGQKVDRKVLYNALKAVFNEQYGKGFPNKNSAMNSKYSDEKNEAIGGLSVRSGLSQDDLISDINYNNCVQVVNILNQKLSTALNYLNQTKGTNIDMNIMKKAINLNGSTQAVTAVRDLVKGNIKNYNLDNNMEDAITYVNTQSQNN